MSIKTAAPAASIASASARPTSVNAAFALWIAEVVASAIGGLLILTVASTTPQIENLSATESGTASAFLVAMGVGIIAIALLRAFFAVKMRGGAHWARVVLTVLGVPNILAVAGGGWVGWVAAALVVAAIVATWVPSSNAFFASTKRH